MKNVSLRTLVDMAIDEKPDATVDEIIAIIVGKGTDKPKRGTVSEYRRRYYHKHGWKVKTVAKKPETTGQGLESEDRISS